MTQDDSRFTRRSSMPVLSSVTSRNNDGGLRRTPLRERDPEDEPRALMRRDRREELDFDD